MADINFMIDIQTRIPGAAAAQSTMSKLGAEMNRTASQIRNVEAAQKRLNAAGQVSSSTFQSLAAAKQGLQAKLAAVTAEYGKMAGAQQRASSFAKAHMSQLAALAAAEQKTAHAIAQARARASSRAAMPVPGAAVGRMGELGNVAGMVAPRVQMVGTALRGLAAAVGPIGLVVAAIFGMVAASAAAAVALAKLGIAFMRMVVPAAMAVEKTQLALRMITGSAAAGQAAYERARKIADDLGLSVGEVSDQMKRLLALQLSMDQAEGIIKMAADMRALGADAQKVDSIIRAIGQIKGKGKLQMEELQQQLAETGIATAEVIDQLGKKLGKSSEEIRKMISAGKIGADVAIEAIQNAVLAQLGMNKLGDASEEALGTVDGIWTALKNKFSSLVTEVGEHLVPVLKEHLVPLLRKLWDFLKSPTGAEALERVKGVAMMLAGAFIRLAGIATGFIQGFVQGIAGSEKLGQSLTEIDPAALQQLVESARQFGESVGAVLGKVMALINALERLRGLQPNGGGMPGQAGGLRADIPQGINTEGIAGGGFQAGMALGQGMANGINASTALAVSAASSMAAQVAATAKAALQLGSPSRLFEQYGKWTGEGFEQGIEASAPGAGAAMSGMMSPSKPGGGGGAKLQVGDITINVTAGSGNGEEIASVIVREVTKLFEGISIQSGAPPAPEAT